MKLAKYIVKRLAVFIPLFFGVILVTFVLVRMLPGNPAYSLAGGQAYAETIESLLEKMGLDQPVYIQFINYARGILKGDLGRSWFNSTNVLDDIIKRFPATLELITLSLVVALVLGLTFAVISARKPKGIIAKTSQIYGLLAGAFADFWLGLMFVYVFYTVMRIAVSPVGRIDMMFSPPPFVTGMYLTDSLIAGDWQLFKNSLEHLALPVLTLGFVQGASVMKMTLATMNETLESDYIFYARLLGISERKVMAYAFKNSTPAIVMNIGNIYSYLLGGAVLVESVFSWGGLGQYVVAALENKDYNCIQGYMLVATLFSMLVYLLIDLIQMVADPRIKY